MTAGVSVRAIRDLERGSVARPRPSTLWRLAGGLGLTPAATRTFIATASGADRPTRRPFELFADLRCEPVIPAQLPRMAADLVGRDDDLHALDKAVACNSAAPILVHGCAGVGKSALVLAWAHGNADLYPDGQLHVDLHGSACDGPPLPPERGLGQLVRALAGADAAVPDHIGDRLGLYRSLAAGRRLLVILDDAGSSRQVTDLLPPSPQSTVIVTSRPRLDGLAAEHGAELIELQPLPTAVCLQLLARFTGPGTLHSHHHLITQLITECGHLPGLLTAAGAHLAAYPNHTTDTITELLNQPRPWQLDTNDLPP